MRPSPDKINRAVFHRGCYGRAPLQCCPEVRHQCNIEGAFPCIYHLPVCSVNFVGTCSTKTHFPAQLPVSRPHAFPFSRPSSWCCLHVWVFVQFLTVARTVKHVSVFTFLSSCMANPFQPSGPLQKRRGNPGQYVYWVTAMFVLSLSWLLYGIAVDVGRGCSEKH